MTEPNWIAEQEVVFVRADGHRTPGRLAIGAPFVVDELQASCAVALDGLHGRLPAISGGSTLQALALALDLMGRRCRDFCGKGGRIEFPSEDGGEVGEELPLDAFFGVSLDMPVVR